MGRSHHRLFHRGYVFSGAYEPRHHLQNRLAIHRGAGYDSINKQIEEYYFCLIKQHYEHEAVLVETNVPYTFEGIGRDIDVMVCERGSKRLLIGMLRAFINPDTVEQVVRANEQLPYGIEQAAEALA